MFAATMLSSMSNCSRVGERGFRGMRADNAGPQYASRPMLCWRHSAALVLDGATYWELSYLALTHADSAH